MIPGTQNHGQVENQEWPSCPNALAGLEGKPSTAPVSPAGPGRAQQGGPRVSSLLLPQLTDESLPWKDNIIPIPEILFLNLCKYKLKDISCISHFVQMAETGNSCAAGWGPANDFDKINPFLI